MADKRVWIADRSKHRTYQKAVRKAKEAKRTPPGRWRVHWIDPELARVVGPKKAERNKTFQVLGDERSERSDTARGYKRQLERELNGDAGAIYIDPNAKETPFGEIAETWFQARDIKRSTRNDYRTALDTHILPQWSEVPIGSITATALASWINRLKKFGGLTDDPREKLGTSSRRTVFTITSSVFDWAVPEFIPSNPMHDKKKIRRPKPKKIHDHAYLDYHEIEQLADIADGLLTKYGRPAIGVRTGRHGLLIRVLAYTGMRIGEALALRVEHVLHGAERPAFQIRSTFVEDDRTGEIYEDTPKDHESRDVPIPASLVADIAAHCKGRKKTDLLFHYDDKPMRLRNWRMRIFNIARERCGFTKKLTPHKLRHTAASLAIRAGATVLSVQKLLGHASATETLKTYAHLWGDEVWQVAEALDRGRLQSLAAASDLGALVPIVAELAQRLDEVRALLEVLGVTDSSEALHRELERLEDGARSSIGLLDLVAADVDEGRTAALARAG